MEKASAFFILCVWRGPNEVLDGKSEKDFFFMMVHRRRSPFTVNFFFRYFVSFAVFAVVGMKKFFIYGWFESCCQYVRNESLFACLTALLPACRRPIIVVMSRSPGFARSLFAISP